MALHWDYQLDLKVDGNDYRVTFDDWLYQIDTDLVINRSYIKKWGFTLGEVILVIIDILPHLATRPINRERRDSC